MTAASEEQIVWSKSQVEAFRDCGRKGLFTISRRRPLQISAETQDSLDRFKKLRNRHLWASDVVHQTVAQILKDFRQGASPTPIETLIDRIRSEMRDQSKESKQASGDFRLAEHEFGVTIPNEIWQFQWKSIEKSIRWFAESKWYDRLSKLGPECWKAVDELLNFDVGGIKAYCKIDCAVEIDGRFHLIDWKASSVKTQDEAGLQVAALYAHEVWGAEPSAITATAVSLSDGRSLTAHITEESMMDTFLRIEQEAASVEERSAELGIDPFSLPLADTELCVRCNYRTVCRPKGANA